MKRPPAWTRAQSWKFKRPLLIGDTIHVVQELLEKSDPKPESDRGKVTFHRTVYNQRDEVIQEGDLSWLIRKRPKDCT